MTDLLDGNGMCRDDLIALATVVGHSEPNGQNPMKPRHREPMVTTLHRLAGEAGPGDVFAIEIRKVRI